MVIGLAKACQSIQELQLRMAELYGRQPVQYTLFLPPPSQSQAVKSQPSAEQPPLLGFDVDSNG